MEFDQFKICQNNYDTSCNIYWLSVICQLWIPQTLFVSSNQTFPWHTKGHMYQWCVRTKVTPTWRGTNDDANMLNSPCIRAIRKESLHILLCRPIPVVTELSTQRWCRFYEKGPPGWFQGIFNSTEANTEMCFAAMSGFHNVIGIIDFTYIWIQAPRKDGQFDDWK